MQVFIENWWAKAIFRAENRFVLCAVIYGIFRRMWFVMHANGPSKLTQQLPVSNYSRKFTSACNARNVPRLPAKTPVRNALWHTASLWMLTSRGKYVQTILQAFRFASLANQNGCRMKAGEKLLHLKFLCRNSEVLQIIFKIPQSESERRSDDHIRITARPVSQENWCGWKKLALLSETNFSQISQFIAVPVGKHFSW